MNPKKSKELYKVTAEELNINEDLVKDLTDMYWNEIRKSITGLKHHLIYVAGIGTFNAKSWKLSEIREKYEKRISYNNGSNFRKMAIKAELEGTVAKIKILEEQITEATLRKKHIKDKRNDKTNLEKQVANPRGDNEQPLQEGSSREGISKENEDMQSMSTD